MRRAVTIYSVLLLLGGLVLGTTGCDSGSQERPDRPESPDAPPPPTPEEIAAKAIADLGLDQPLPRRGARLPANVRQNILQKFESEHARLSGTPEGKAALRIVQRKLEERIDALEQQESWEHLLTFTDAYKKFDPDTQKYELIRETALIELRKPRVQVKGLPEFDGRKVAWLEIYTPMNSQTYEVKLTRGEEMHGIKMLNFFGDDKGIEIEYSETGERAIVYLPSAK